MAKVDYMRPEVSEALPQWEIVEDCIAGEAVVKSKRDKYLPKPNGEIDEVYASKRYEAYVKRAVFYNATGRTLDGLVGQVFAKDSKVDLPELLTQYLDDIDGAGTSLEHQAKVTLGNVLAFGHGGVLSDFPSDVEVVTKLDLETGRVRPRVLNIHPRNIINWRVQTVGGETLLSLLVLAECKIVEDDGFEFKTEPRWRVFRLHTPEGIPAYVEVEVWRKSTTEERKSNPEMDFVLEDNFLPQKYNSQPLGRIPFEFVGSINNEPTVDKSPIPDLATLNVAHYRNSADYEESLYLVGQPTPVFSGLTQDWVDTNIKGKVVLGSRSAISLPQGAQAELLQATPNGLTKEGMGHKEELMRSIGAKLIEPNFSKTTATEVLYDASSEASVLSGAAKNVSDAYEKALAHAGVFIGEVSLKDITFELNTNFDANRMDAQERAQLVAEWQGGLITWEEARTRLRHSGIAYEDDETAKVKVEEYVSDNGEDNNLENGQ